jgi:hypothetical protein
MDVLWLFASLPVKPRQGCLVIGWPYDPATITVDVNFDAMLVHRIPYIENPRLLNAFVVILFGFFDTFLRRIDNSCFSLHEKIVS